MGSQVPEQVEDVGPNVIVVPSLQVLPSEVFTFATWSLYRIAAILVDAQKKSP
jgi:hypothetical protein